MATPTTTNPAVDLSALKADWEKFTQEVFAAAEELARRCACVKCGKPRKIASYVGEHSKRLKIDSEEGSIRYGFGIQDDDALDWFRIVNSSNIPRETIGWICRACSPVKPEKPEATP